MSESKLDEIFEDLAVSVYKADIPTIDTLNADAKRRVKDLFKEVVGEALVERRHNPLSGENIDLVDRAELLKAIEEL